MAIEGDIKTVGAGLATLGMIGAGIGVGNVFTAFISGVARNPSARNAVYTETLLGFAVVEAIALFAFVVAVLILFAS